MYSFEWKAYLTLIHKWELDQGAELMGKLHKLPPSSAYSLVYVISGMDHIPELKKLRDSLTAMALEGETEFVAYFLRKFRRGRQRKELAKIVRTLLIRRMLIKSK